MSYEKFKVGDYVKVKQEAEHIAYCQRNAVTAPSKIKAVWINASGKQLISLESEPWDGGNFAFRFELVNPGTSSISNTEELQEVVIINTYESEWDLF